MLDKIKVVILLTLLLVIGCSKTSLDLAKQGIRRNIGKYLNNPDYYESVSWGSLDSVFVTETPDQLSDLQFEISDPSEAKELHSLLSHVHNNNLLNPDWSKIEKTVAEAWLKKQDIKYTVKEKPIFKRYLINHTFRVGRPGQRKILMKYQFMLDSTYNIINADKQDIQTFD